MNKEGRERWSSEQSKVRARTDQAIDTSSMARNSLRYLVLGRTNGPQTSSQRNSFNLSGFHRATMLLCVLNTYTL